MAKAVEFYFDVGSPAAYIAWQRLPAICAQAGAAIDYRPMLLGGVFQATGNQSPLHIAAKGRYVMDELARFARRDGIAFRHNPSFPINTLMLMRGATGLQPREPARMVPYVDAMFRAIWAEGRDMNDSGVVASVLSGCGVRPRQRAGAGERAASQGAAQGRHPGSRTSSPTPNAAC